MSKADLDAMVADVVRATGDVDAMLGRAMDALVAETKAERGFFIIVGKDGGLSFHSARNIDQEEVQAPELKISRTVIGEAIVKQEPILTAEGERFSESESLKRIRPLSILCVPIVHRENVIGVVYLDNRFLPRLFREAHKELVAEFARRIAATLAARLKASEDVDTYPDLVGRGAAMRAVKALLDKVAPTDLPVLVCGESGTGKELVARAIHFHGPRAKKPFVAENCGAITPTLLESELFGHVRGSFTGAEREKLGLLEVAHTGTLFLDEIASTPLAMQVKLLRALQEGEIRRVGGKDTIKIDVRIIAASNQDLDRLVAEGKFRQDLYYRLKVISIDLPPLRHRPEDIPSLAEHFLKKISSPKGLTPAAVTALSSYRWPGNVRELENEVRRASALSGDVIDVGDLSPEVSEAGRKGTTMMMFPGTLKDVERSTILAALEKAGGNKKEAAKLLGIPRTTLYHKMKLLDLPDSNPV